ncbi:MAG: glycosyltransferase family 2 protein, partial [Dehalococcoidia bacterium]
MIFRLFICSIAIIFADQVIVIDDGSDDGTARLAEKAGATLVSHNINRGYGASLKSGFEIGKLINADVLVILDGDGQHDPEDMPKLLAPIVSKQADVVIGSRLLKCEGNIPRYRKFGIQLIT